MWLVIFIEREHIIAYGFLGKNPPALPPLTVVPFMIWYVLRAAAPARHVRRKIGFIILLNFWGGR